MPPFGSDVAHPKPQEHPSLAWRANTRGCHQHWRLASNQTDFEGVFFVFFGIFLSWFLLGGACFFCLGFFDSENFPSFAPIHYNNSGKHLIVFGVTLSGCGQLERGPCSLKLEGFISHKIKALL